MVPEDRKGRSYQSALHELWRLQERAGLIQKQLAPGFTEGVHLTEDFVVEKKGSFYLKVRRKNGT